MKERILFADQREYFYLMPVCVIIALHQKQFREVIRSKALRFHSFCTSQSLFLSKNFNEECWSKKHKNKILISQDSERAKSISGKGSSEHYSLHQ